MAVVDDGSDGLRLADEWAPELVVLDLMLLKVDGLEVRRQLRRDSHVPIIMLTARGEKMGRVVVSTPPKIWLFPTFGERQEAGTSM